MLKIYTAAVLIFLLIPVDLSIAQSKGYWFSKIYLGDLNHIEKKQHATLWHKLFGKKSVKIEPDLKDRTCSIEFKSTIPFTHQLVSRLPEEISYFIHFSGDRPPFKKFVITLYTTDGEDHVLDPDAEGRQLGINEEHHIFDPYLIYLILGPDIDHIEVQSANQGGEDIYVLDKIQIHDDD